MKRKPFLHIGIILFLLATLFVLQLPQIHSHPTTPVEPYQCPLVLVNSNTLGLIPLPLLFYSVLTLLQLINPFNYSDLFLTVFIPTSIILRGPPVL